MRGRQVAGAPWVPGGAERSASLLQGVGCSAVNQLGPQLLQEIHAETRFTVSNPRPWAQARAASGCGSGSHLAPRARSPGPPGPPAISAQVGVR